MQARRTSVPMHTGRVAMSGVRGPIKHALGDIGRAIAA